MNGHDMALLARYGYEVVELENRVWSRDPNTGIMRTDTTIIFPRFPDHYAPNLRLTRCQGDDGGIDFRAEHDTAVGVHVNREHLRALRRWIKDNT